MTRVIFECLRLYPSIGILPRRSTTRQTKFGDVTIPAETFVSVNLFNRSYDACVWEEPETFCPARFDKSTSIGAKCPAMSSQDYFPFGQGNFKMNYKRITEIFIQQILLGKRMCIGKQFSLIEQRVIISMIVAKYQLSLPPGSPHAEKLRLRAGGAGLISVKDLELKFTLRTT